MATVQPVPGPALRQLVSGAKLHLDTPLGTKIPVAYGSDGALSGDAKGLGSYLGAERDEGRWWVARGRLCHRWNTWFEARPQCLSLQRRGVRLYWQNQDGKSGTATLVAPAKTKTVTVAVAQTSPAAKVQIKPQNLTKVTARDSNKVKRNTNVVTPQSGLAAQTPDARRVAKTSSASPAVTTKIETVRAITVPLLDPETISNETPPTPSRLHALATPRLNVAASQQAIEVGNLEGRPPAANARPSRVAVAKVNKKKRTLRMAHAGSPKGPIYRVSFVEPFDVLNVRSGPSEAFAVVGSLKPRAKGVRITGPCRIDWCPIRFRKIKGWVNRFYLQPVKQRGAPRKGGVRSSAWAAVAASDQ